MLLARGFVRGGANLHAGARTSTKSRRRVRRGIGAMGDGVNAHGAAIVRRGDVVNIVDVGSTNGIGGTAGLRGACACRARTARRPRALRASDTLSAFEKPFKRDDRGDSA
ncbi:hypothetical protein [Paraburkholderia sp. J41]|uniref:hypothetical protein n=1 Tax=Paraburkholderia sp. J41 TaxID=2805433 RepID=UPI002AC32538|nr:hypothetical protein [Paraburkholderia sp. J41]